MPDVAISGVGIVTSVGQGKQAVQKGLAEQRHAFRIMQRPGRQSGETKYIGAELAELDLPAFLTSKVRRTASLSSLAAISAVAEAWADANLGDLEPERIGLVVGGSNLQQRELVLLQESYRDRLGFLRPNYGMVFLDTDVLGICTETFGIKGLAYNVAAASASGHLAIIQAAEAVQAGHVDACIAVGALTDLSYWECQGLRSMGAMGSDSFSDDPAGACRPFDRRHNGFIFGESCAAVVVEPLPTRGRAYAQLAGWSMIADGHRNPDPSLVGESRAIQMALKNAGLAPAEIEYVNTHGTGSTLGDMIELEALRSCGLVGARLNATKSILGHGLSSAGAVEVVATLLQMEAGYLHATRNLEEPIDEQFAWVRGAGEDCRIVNALNLSFGFSGMSSAICLRNLMVR